MKSLITLHSLLQDASKSLCIDTSRDLKTIEARLKHEGVSFLTITLPSFSSWLEQSLEAGLALPTITSSFKALGFSVLPCFLQGLTKRVFDPKSGILRQDADPSAVFFIRAICSCFKKLKLPCTERRNRLAIEKFEATDKGLPEHIVLDNVTRSVAYVVLDTFAPYLQADPMPKHGPGATYERVMGNQKYTFREYYERWQGIVDPEDLFGQALEGGRSITIIREKDEQPCRLSLVPKTLKSPRLIAVEPVAMQYGQQYLASQLVQSMRSSPLTRHIDFTDQSVNRDLAKRGSIDGSVSTIDLSEASDRVSLALVREIFASDPVLLAQLLAFRSSVLEVPRLGNVPKHYIPLRKYSTSGSALTFPVETLVFFILALSVLVRRDIGNGRSLRASISSLAQSVAVYGDDIVVPSDSCSDVCQALEAYGLKVNLNKTFSKGLFRESCGGDYFKGYDVTPVYIKHDLPVSVSESESVIASVANSNLFHWKGAWSAAAAIRDYIDLTIRKLPLVLPTSPGLGWWSHTGQYTKTKVLANFNYGVKTLCSVSKRVDDAIDGSDALLKFFLSKGISEEADHLLKSVPRYSNRLRVKWTTPY